MKTLPLLEMEELVVKSSSQRRCFTSPLDQERTTDNFAIINGKPVCVIGSDGPLLSCWVPPLQLAV